MVTSYEKAALRKPDFPPSGYMVSEGFQRLLTCLQASPLPLYPRQLQTKPGPSPICPKWVGSAIFLIPHRDSGRKQPVEPERRFDMQNSSSETSVAKAFTPVCPALQGKKGLTARVSPYLMVTISAYSSTTFTSTRRLRARWALVLFLLRGLLSPKPL